jgi:lysyl-tRNA synthetase class 2
MSDSVPDISHDQHAVRRQKLAELRAAGFDPFRANVATTHFSQDAKTLYVDGQDYTVPVTCAGRLVTFRVQGGSSFVKIQDQQGPIQLYFRKDVLGEERYLVFKTLATSSASPGRSLRPRPARSPSAWTLSRSSQRRFARSPKSGTA